MSRLEWLINKANLNIYEFNVEKRTEMKSIDRLFGFYVMSYIQEGAAKAVVNGELLDQPAGTVLLVPANVKHSHFIPEGSAPTTFLWWHFNITASAIDIMKYVPFPIILELKDRQTFEKLFFEYMAICQDKLTLPALVRRKAKEFEIMAFLFEDILDTEHGTDSTLDEIPDEFFQMMQDIIEHPERNASLQELSERYHLHATYISNRFKKIFGVTPMRLHNRVLIEHIKTELSNAASPQITLLAKQFGFRDISSFTHFFTSHAGCSPTDFWKRCRDGAAGFDGSIR